MPLDKPEGYDVAFVPYEVKLAIVEHNCKNKLASF